MSSKQWLEDNQEKMREYRIAYYYRNKDKELARVRKNNKLKTKQIRQFLTDYKVLRGCQVCGEKHPACLDLHHLNPEEKKINPSAMARMQWAMSRIEDELENV